MSAAFLLGIVRSLRMRDTLGLHDAMSDRSVLHDVASSVDAAPGNPYITGTPSRLYLSIVLLLWLTACEARP
jgi:hypothetical protein